jgi:CubicO group peptidase (beta-lactamase class C family)
MRDPRWWTDLVDEMTAFQRANPANLPGAVFAVDTRRDGPLTASVGQGWGAATICEIGTMSKVFTATAVLLALEEHGLLDIETEAWRLPGMEAYAHDDVRRRIRVRHLLQHTSGLPTIQPYTASPKSACNDPDRPWRPCPDASTELGPTVPWTCYPGGTNEYVLVDGRCRPARQVTLAQVSEHVMRTYVPLSEPGGRYLYSPINYVVVARIVEALSGRSLNVYLRDRLFRPLGMTDCFFVAQPTGEPDVDAWIDEGVTGSQRARIADITLITHDGQMPPEVAPGPDGRWDRFRRGWRFVFPDGGMYATVGDLLAFLRVLRDGGRATSEAVLSPEVVRLLVEDQGFGHTMGFGYRTQATPYGQGAGTIEHFGSKMTYFWLDPRSDAPVIGVFLSQRLPNISINPNMGIGMRPIFRVFLPGVAAREGAIPSAVG